MRAIRDVGYGPDPLAVTDLVRNRVALTVKGNHDEALVSGGHGFSGIALRAIDWTRGPWSATFAQNFQKSYHDTGGNLADPAVDPEAFHDARAYVTYDAQVTYSGIKNWKFTLGARNLFDADPPYVNTNAAFQAGYDPQYADPRGRFVYARVTYAF